jgi:hypothetical protein
MHDEWYSPNGHQKGGNEEHDDHERGETGEIAGHLNN